MLTWPLAGFFPSSLCPGYDRALLLWAAINGYKKIVEFLHMKDGVNPDSKTLELGDLGLKYKCSG
jgi:hypothetical protein